MGELQPYQKMRKEALLQRLRNETLTRLEAEELRGILEQERNVASQTGDWKAALATGLLIIGILAFLASLVDDR